MKKLKKLSRKVFNVFLIVGMLLATIGIPPFLEVSADSNLTKIELQVSNGANTISIDTNDKDKLVYKIGQTIVGYVKVKVGGVYKKPEMNGNKAMFELPQWVENYQVDIEATAASGYTTQQNYFYEQASLAFPGDKIIHADITKNNIHSLDFSFEISMGGGQGGPIDSEIGIGGGQGDPMAPEYPIVAYFGNDVNTAHEPNHEGKIIIPENWTSGKIAFKAKICTLENGDVIPNLGNCEGTSSELPVKPMIANSDQINKTVVPAGNERGELIAANNFIDYGKMVLHIVNFNENDPMINSIISVESSDLVSIAAVSTLGMSDFIGSDYLNKAIYTKEGVRDASIFFGNSETTLIASGNNVKKINAVRGESLLSVNITDGEANLTLPDLSVETTTFVEVDIELLNGTVITRNLNIKRTAIFLEHGTYKNGVSQVRAGYVLNKNYLYNIVGGFDAYLQVMLYKDNTVVGYKQIQIKDDSLLESLNDMFPSGYMNTFDWDGFGEKPLYNPIIIYNEGDGDPSGVNGASVFLTNGPIDFDSDTLPSIEFGIGAGAQISWEAE